MPFTVQDLIKDRRRPVVVALSDTAQKAVNLMMEYDFSQLPVVDGEEKPRGMVTGDSILRAHSSLDLPLGKLHVRDAMSKKPREFEAGDDLFEMLEYVMDSAAVLIVDGEGRLTGIVTSYDTTEYFRRRAEDLMLLEDIEMSLREHIRCAYSGPNGHDAGKAASAKFEDLNLSDYIQMVVHGDKWAGHFQPIFSIEPAALNFMLEKVRETRNALAHFRGEIDSAQRNHLRFCTEWLGRHPAPIAPAQESSRRRPRIRWSCPSRRWRPSSVGRCRPMRGSTPRGGRTTRWVMSSLGSGCRSAGG
ncbi:MAG: CBS domain-containing protein [Polyangiaceae bacterium]